MAKYPFNILKSLIPTKITQNQINIYIIIAVIIGFATVPFFIDVDTSYFAYYLFLTFLFIVIAQGWNIVAGYAGQISLCQNSFFGLGAYTTGLIWLYDVTKTGYYFDPVVMLLSGLVPVILAIIVGIPLLSRLRGDYFALGTLGVQFTVTVLMLKGGAFTRGADGLHLPSVAFESMLPYYWVGLLLALFAVAVVYFINRSNIGLALKAIREDETSAASRGVHVLQYKVFAFAVGASLTGIAGSLYGIYLFHINPDSVMNLNWLFYPILMCVLGGNGTIMGPIIGAFALAALLSYGDVYLLETHPILSGLIIILVMKFMPTGIIGLKDKILSRR
ncbi:MAG: branched-chain amino acid ABC transporter permease [Dehalococcoidia bacterium]|nr:branched-chain amino acid ABC transporter permease [Dehalococcoidia bacterium]